MTVDFAKKVFLADAIVCALTFVGCVFATQAIAADTGLGTGPVAAAGWICLGAALIWGWLGTRARPPILICWLAIFLNIDWIIASVVLFELEYASLTAYGRALIVAQAVGVLGFVVLEVMGVRAIGRQRVAAA
ncbi:hypothetical protein HFP57_06320 [Parasphingopyxis algicola]|uniref:hypothetical protein n=1 Tax=Parasphingopyxis algicola TaxID=2026624 RepID=UPI0015A310CB|nr:hypothetical protein [Parasphingopyxis algicola]QLC24681.1 hypothetical protein HFP57_06320 [Parasphingopyxis algicola]